MKTGILLPRSSTHPLISYNFMDGIHTFLKHRGLSNEIECVTASIGYGTDTALIQQEAERLILEHRVDLLVIFADYPVVECLFPVVTSLNKLLIIVNHGAKYPPSWAASPNVIHHSLNNASNCWLTGKLAAKENKSAALVSSFYDGGYSITHAIAASFMDDSGQIAFNFVGHQQKERFNTEPLISFLKAKPEVDSLLATLSGELGPELYLQLREQAADKNLKLYACPVLLEESLYDGTLNPEETIAVSGYTSWFKASEQEENQAYCQTFKKETNREPDSFGVLGWDTGLILKSILEISEGKTIDANTISRHPDLQKLQGAKGEMHLHAYTQHFISPVHYLHSGLSKDAVKHHDLPLETVEASFNELINFEIQGPSSQWLNTYLCS